MVTWFYPNARPAVATLAALSRLCAASYQATVRINMPDSGLAKHLVQSNKRFHSPLMYQLVLRLHRLVLEHRLSVTIRGGVEFPPDLQSAFDRVTRTRITWLKDLANV
jgi:hypothetical protein